MKITVKEAQNVLNECAKQLTEHYLAVRNEKTRFDVLKISFSPLVDESELTIKDLINQCEATIKVKTSRFIRPKVIKAKLSNADDYYTNKANTHFSEPERGREIRFLKIRSNTRPFMFHHDSDAVVNFSLYSHQAQAIIDLIYEISDDYDKVTAFAH